MRVKPGALGGWTKRLSDDIVAWDDALAGPPGPACYINPDSWVPARLQLFWHRMRLWFQRWPSNT